MNRQRVSSVLVLLLITIQVFGPAALWAAEQRGVRIEANDRVVISAISEGSLTAESRSGLRTLHFGEVVTVGEQIETGPQTVVDVLIGNRAVVTLGRNTTAQLTMASREQTTILVTTGIVRVAASSEALGEEGIMTIQTPTSQVKTHGGIVRVIVNVPNDFIAHGPAGEAKLYLASYSPDTMIAALNTGGDIILVEEGIAEIPGAGLGGEALTLNAGQSVTLQSGQAGAIAELEPHETMRTGVLASADHTKTPKEGLEHLVALQVDQATQLGQALTGAEKTGQDESDKKDTSENVINGATGGVQVASTIVNTLFGGGNASNPTTPNPTDSTGGGFGGNNNQGFFASNSTGNPNVAINGASKANGGPKALLVFTRKDPVEPFVKETKTITTAISGNGTYYMPGDPMAPPDDTGACNANCLRGHQSSTPNQLTNVGFRPLSPVTSEFTVVKELVLVGGMPNAGHGGVAPTETLIVRGAAPENNGDPPVTNLASEFPRFGLYPTDRFPAKIQLFGGDLEGFQETVPSEIVSANSTFVVETPSVPGGDGLVGGTLGQFSNLATSSPNGIVITDQPIEAESHVDGAITATGSDVVLTGGVTLDRGTVATIGTTTATNNYFNSFGGSDAKFSGSLLSVINGPSGPTALTVQDRLLGVYDGSTIDTNGGNKALLSVLDAQLTGPVGVPLIDIDAAFQDDGVTPGSQPDVTVTSAVVTRSTIPLPNIPLDSALLEASAPLLALTKATMTTASHFADLAGNQALSIKLGDALVALNASQLIIQNGNLLNLNNATAAVNGFLFSLNDSSTLTIANGTLFSLNDGSTLNLDASAFGVFGSGANALSITNNLCAATCGTLVNSANTPFMVNGSALQVAGVTQDVVLPNSFNVFAGNPASTVNISADAALFHIDSTSTLTINGTAVVN